MFLMHHHRSLIAPKEISISIRIDNLTILAILINYQNLIISLHFHVKMVKKICMFLITIEPFKNDKKSHLLFF